MSFDVPFIRPTFPRPDDVAGSYQDILASNWFTNFGPQERALSSGLGDYLSAGSDARVDAVTFANGTLALMAAIHALVGQAGEGRQILLPSFTFVAAGQVVATCGYRPLFVDIDPVTWQPDPRAARSLIERSEGDVAAILLANVFGIGNPEIAAWESLARSTGLPLIIDSAAGFGSRYDDQERVGGRGDCEIFSFHATKPFAIGEGGALSSRDPSVIERAVSWQNFGFGPDRLSRGPGLNAKLQELSAAIGLHQLHGFDERLETRQATYERYRQALIPEGLTFAPNAERSALCFASACAESPGHKQRILDALARNGVEARDYYNPPVHRHPAMSEQFGKDQMDTLGVTDDVCSRIVSLPIHDHMAPADVNRVLAAVRGAR